MRPPQRVSSLRGGGDRRIEQIGRAAFGLGGGGVGCTQSTQANFGSASNSTLPLAVDDALNEIRLDAEAAVSKHRVRTRHFQRRNLRRAQRQRQIARQRVFREAEALR